MIDPKLLRGALDELADVLSTRGYVLDVAFWQTLEQERKSLQSATETLQGEVNKASRAIGLAKKEGKDASALLDEMTLTKQTLKTQEDALRHLLQKIEEAALQIPNLPDVSVPVGRDEADNVELRRWGAPRCFDFPPKDHVQLAQEADALDFACAASMTGSRFSLLSGELARLHRALTAFMLDTHTRAGYIEHYTPYIVNDTSLIGTGQLPKFEEDLFKIEGKDWYLIPTAEVPLTNIAANSVLDEDNLPLKLCAHTPCFRSEAGSAGRDTRGLVRQHQFDKVEMVNVVLPQESDAALDAMTAQAQRILEALELPYRTVLLCTGDMGFGAQKTYDLEVWLPSQETYREISSCSNCGDFQARRMGIRTKSGKKTALLHTLNGSGLAVGRCLLALLENHQNPDGSITLPACLAPYMGGQTSIFNR